MIDQFLSQPASGEAVAGIEGLIRTALFGTGTAIVGYLLQVLADRIDASYQPRPGETFKERTSVSVQCLFGTFPLKRDYYYHPALGGHYPADDAMGVEVGCTPALARLACLEGADESGFDKAQKHLLETGGIDMDSRQIHRLIQRVGPVSLAWQQREYKIGQEDRTPVPIMYVSADGTGIPMRKKELEGRAGKQADGTSKTRQVYLGCVFTQHQIDEKGRPVRDWNSTTYVSSMESNDVFGPILRAEALRRGMAYAEKVILLIDGARGLENLGLCNFKDALQIVDFYHAMEHAGKVLVVLLGNKDHPDYKRRRGHWARRLLKNGVQNLIAEARQECAGDSRSEALEKELTYFVNNIQRMQYGTFRKQGYFIGSGVIEAGCKTVVGGRCKQSGMFWGKPGAEHILSLRCINASWRDAEFWNHRINLISSRYPSRKRAAKITMKNFVMRPNFVNFEVNKENLFLPRFANCLIVRTRSG